MATQFQTEYLFKRLPDFWSYFEDREDQKNIWDAYLRKVQALHSLLTQADFSKSLKSIPLLDRNQLEYFIFSKLVRRTDLELNRPFYVYEVDPTIFFIKNLYEKIDATEGNRVLSPGTYYQVTPGTGAEQGKTFLEFLRGVNPSPVGETYWIKGSVDVTKTDGSKFSSSVAAGDVIQGPNQEFYKITSVVSDTHIKIQGLTVLDQLLGSGDGAATDFNLRTPAIFTEVSDELVVTGPVAPGILTLDHPIYDPATLQLRYGPSFDTGLPMVLDSDYSIADPNLGTFALSISGTSTLGSDQLHARYNRANPYIITSSVEVRVGGRVVAPVSYYPDELVASGTLAPGIFQLDFFPVDTGTLELHAGSITGTILLDPADYTVNLANGQVTLTAAGAAKVNAASPKELRAKYARTEYTVDAYGLVTFTLPPASGSAVEADYFLGYFGPTGHYRRTVVEHPPTRLFSRAVYRDRKAVYNNFGYAIGYERPISMKYLNEVRGLYFARYNGPTISNMDLGAGILGSIPFSPRGRVDRVQTVSPKSVVVDGNLIPVPDPLTPIVTAGEQLPRDFNLLTDGVRTADYINDPALFQLNPLFSDIRKFFTFFVLVKGSYAIWVCQQTGQPIDYSLLTKFVTDIKPSYTDAAVLTDLDFIADNLNFFIGAVDVSNSYEATNTVEFNPLNFCVIPQYMRTNGYSYTVADELLATAPVAAGIYALDFDEILTTGVPDDPTPVPFELHLGTIAGPLLAAGVDYTLNAETGVVTLLVPQAQDIHAQYTSGIVDEALLASSGTVDLDLDCVQLYEELHVIQDTVGISTLENNLVNFGVSPPGPEGMDDDTIQYTEAMTIHDAIGTPPGSWNPPFSPGALIYSF